MKWWQAGTNSIQWQYWQSWSWVERHRLCVKIDEWTRQNMSCKVPSQQLSHTKIGESSWSKFGETAKPPENAFTVLGGSMATEKRRREVREEQDKTRRRERRRDKIPPCLSPPSVSPLATSFLCYLLLGFVGSRLGYKLIVGLRKKESGAHHLRCSPRRSLCRLRIAPSKRRVQGTAPSSWPSTGTRTASRRRNGRWISSCPGAARSRSSMSGVGTFSELSATQCEMYEFLESTYESKSRLPFFIKQPLN